VKRVALVVALLVAACGGGGGATRAEVGERAPTFAAPRLVGDGEVRLSEFRGKPVLLNFFASWCTPCRQELPLLQEAHDEGEAAVVGVLFKDSADAARSFLRELGVMFPTVDDDGAIARAYRVDFKPGLPMTYAIDAAGVLVARHIGQLRAEDVPDLIEKAS
jgi:thiol-disulfide isomerase/thioredoxin